jgi:hypothetical protein
MKKWNGENRAWIYTTLIDWWLGWTQLRVGPEYKDENRWYAKLVQSVARLLLEHTGWEGDNRGGANWWMSGVPSQDCTGAAIILAVKQDNNGRTFVFSQVPLAYLTTDVALVEEVVEVEFDWDYLDEYAKLEEPGVPGFSPGE